MALVVEPDKVICFRCGKAYLKRRGFFPVSYAACHKGVGYIPYCRDCVDVMYASYLSKCGNAKDAVRQMCRKLDIYWSETIFNSVEKKSIARTIMTQYIQKLTTQAYAGKCYDDTLINEGGMWTFSDSFQIEPATASAAESAETDPNTDISDIPEEVVAFWGSGYTPDMYRELEQRKAYWLSSLPDGTEVDIGTEALIRQICPLEMDINRNRAAGRNVDKLVTSLDKLIGSAGLKPAQKKQDDADASMTNTPMGVWLYRYENMRPLPEVDDDLKDVNGIRKYVFTWMGHLCKMLGLKNAYSKLYEDEIARLRVDKPEYEGDDEGLFASELLDGSAEEGDADEPV